MKMLRWAALKNYCAHGFIKGMPDIYYFRPNAEFHGLFIELKSQKPSAKVSDTQLDMLSLLGKNGYKTAVCRGHEEAIQTIQDYERKR
jgi:hypothetical protein